VPRVRGFLLINPRAGSESPTAEELAQAAQERGVEARVLDDGDDPAELARAAEADVLGAAGGDGTVATVGSVAVERDLPFVVVPFGTRNHFARDLGLDRADPLGGLDAFAGEERRVDVGRVGERRFLNNLSLGLYADLVHRREHRRRQGEALAGLRALPRLARERHRLRATLDGDSLRARVLVVANNAYRVSLYTLGERESLEEGRLHLYAADGWLPMHWTERSGPRFRLDLGRPEVIAAADGEPVTLRAPLEVESLPRALRLLVPPK
jgi:diacylglycerol kinase family enzyme